MLKLKSKILSEYYIYFGYLIFSLPFLEFISANQRSVERVALNDFLLYFFLISILYFFIFYILDKVISSQEIKTRFTLSVTIFFWSLFFFENIQNFIFKNWMSNMTSNMSAELSMIFLILFSLMFSNLKFLRFSFNFIFIFFIVQHFVIYFSLLRVNFFEKKNIISEYNKNRNYFSENEINKILNNQKNNKNIYYYVIDGQTSLEEYKNLGGKIDIKELKNFFKVNGYTYVPQTYSSFNDTATTFGSLLNLNLIVTDKKDINNDEYFQLLYPNNLTSFNFKIKGPPELVKNLNNINYNFFWWGNYKYNCNFYNIELCLDSDEFKKKSFLDNKINIYVLRIFLANTPIEEIIRLLLYHLKTYTGQPLDPKIDKQEVALYSLNKDKFSIENFMNKISIYNNKNPNFYFIHTINNTFPFMYDFNCNFVPSFFNKDKKINKDTFLKNYLSSYDCNLKSLKKFIKFLKNHDPEAIVIIQSDHGQKRFYDDINDLRKYEIFNLIKVNESCNKYISNQIDNINSARLSLSCATSSKVKLIKKKIFFTDKIINKNYKIIEISTK